MSRNHLSRIALILTVLAVAAMAHPASAEEHTEVASVSGGADLRASSSALGTLRARLGAPAPAIRSLSFDRSSPQQRLRPGRSRPREARRRDGLSRRGSRMLLHALIGAGVGAAAGSFGGWAVCSNEHNSCPVVTRYTAVGGLVGLGLGIANGTR